MVVNYLVFSSHRKGVHNIDIDMVSSAGKRRARNGVIKYSLREAEKKSESIFPGAVSLINNSIGILYEP